MQSINCVVSLFSITNDQREEVKPAERQEPKLSSCSAVIGSDDEESRHTCTQMITTLDPVILNINQNNAAAAGGLLLDLHFSPATFQKEILNFLLRCIHLTAD